MKTKPVIYEEGELTDFLSEYEEGFLRTHNPDIEEHILNRGKMFLTLHRSWIEYDKKSQVTNKLNKTDWEKKVKRILNLQFKMTNEQGEGIIRQYFTKVTFPKGGIL